MYYSVFLVDSVKFASAQLPFRGRRWIFEPYITLQANFPVLGSEQVTDVSSSNVTTVSGWWGVSTTISGCDDKHTKELHYYLYF